MTGHPAPWALKTGGSSFWIEDARGRCIAILTGPAEMALANGERILALANLLMVSEGVATALLKACDDAAPRPGSGLAELLGGVAQAAELLRQAGRKAGGA